jgi:UDP-2,4-diacetamido-2,4,6-trideoxy-beta-L-altropyranose hydrolase
MIRADASVQMGYGHVMRCLTLADELRDRGASVEFICRENPGGLSEFIEKKRGFFVHKLPIKKDSIKDNDWNMEAKQISEVLKGKNEFIDWLIIDHYEVESKCERKLRPLVKKILVIDDLANREHHCDLLLDQNFYLTKNRYEGKVPKECILLLGPNYALLRKEFTTERKKLKKRDVDIKRVLVFFGGSDPTNETSKVLDEIENKDFSSLTFDIIVGQNNPELERIKSKISQLNNVSIHEQVNNMAYLMSKADFSIGAGGSVHWERCCMGLPSVVVTTASNQVETTEALAEKEIIDYLGECSRIDYYDLLSILKQMNTVKHYRALSVNGMNLVDGLGVNRLVEHVIK